MPARCSFAVVVVAALGLAGAARTSHADKPVRALVIVVAKGSKLKDISHAELRRTFSGNPITVGGDRVVPFNFPPGSPERLAFDQVVLGMSGEQVGRFWVDRKIRGESQAPRALSSAAYITKVVAKVPFAIAYVPSDLVTGDVVVVTIDGVLPTAATYPIKLK